jgi:hypothetical protein
MASTRPEEPRSKTGIENRTLKTSLILYLSVSRDTGDRGEGDKRYIYPPTPKTYLSYSWITSRKAGIFKSRYFIIIIINIIII